MVRHIRLKAVSIIVPTISCAPARASIGDILGNMGTDAQTIQNIAGGDYSSLYPALIGIGSGLINGNLEDAMNGVFTSLGNIFPNATTADYCDLISWVMDNGVPGDLGGLANGQLPSDLIPWVSGMLNPTRNTPKTQTDKSTNYYLDYQSTRNGTVVRKSLREPLMSMYVMIPPSWTRSIKVIT